MQAALLAVLFKMHVDAAHVWVHLKSLSPLGILTRFDWFCGLNDVGVSQESARVRTAFFAMMAPLVCHMVVTLLVLVRVCQAV